MESIDFIDYYEILDVFPGTNLEEIERKFRSLAREYHPDNQSTGSREKFDLVLRAHSTLRDPEKRARYHSDYHYQLSSRWDLTAQNSDFEAGSVETRSENEKTGDDVGIDRDVDIQNMLLTMLYVKRRKNIRDPGIGDAELENLSGCPPEHLEFHLWYMREKGWIRRSEDGLLTITIEGVDRATLIHQAEHARKLITDQS